MDDEPSYDITVTGADNLGPKLVSRLKNAVQATLHHHRATRARIAIALVDDPTIATLNEQHLQHAGPTDVLTFDMRDDRQFPKNVVSTNDDTWTIDGEVVISTDTAARESAIRNHDTDAELALYAVHGTLHLLGYTDAEPEASDAMHLAEDEILTSIGLGSVYHRQSRG